MSALADAPLALVLACYGLVGLLVGSFLNVVIHRLPLMMERRWALERASGEEAQSDQNPADLGLQAPYNLLVPGSACPHCHTALHWWNNVPVLSFLIQKGRCTHCHAPISWRYPLVELACAGLFLTCALHFGPGLNAWAWCAFCATLLAAAVVDGQTSWLPDDLTLPLLWAGLLLSALQWTELPLTQAVWGAALGYGSLWAVFWLFKLATGKEGMGYGDFKLLAAMGAWLGPVALIPLTLIACVLGAAIGLSLIVTHRLRRDQAMPFGPYLALAGGILVFYKAPLLSRLGLLL